MRASLSNLAFANYIGMAFHQVAFEKFALDFSTGAMICEVLITCVPLIPNDAEEKSMAFAKGTDLYTYNLQMRPTCHHLRIEAILPPLFENDFEQLTMIRQVLVLEMFVGMEKVLVRPNYNSEQVYAYSYPD